MNYLKQILSTISDIRYYPKLSKIQMLSLFKKCPNCRYGYLHAVSGNNEEIDEDYLWCDYCDLSMDSDGHYYSNEK